MPLTIRSCASGGGKRSGSYRKKHPSHLGSAVLEQDGAFALVLGGAISSGITLINLRLIISAQVYIVAVLAKLMDLIFVAILCQIGRKILSYERCGFSLFHVLSLITVLASLPGQLSTTSTPIVILPFVRMIASRATC